MAFRCSLCYIAPVLVVLADGSPPRVAKLPKLGFVVFESPSLVSAVLMVLNTGWFKALAFDSTKLGLSSNVISLCLLFVISSATLHHLCLSGRGKPFYNSLHAVLIFNFV